MDYLKFANNGLMLANNGAGRRSTFVLSKKIKQ